MTNTTLLIDEQEKENAKALTQSFVRADVKSRAYINALGAEVCLKYLNENNINSEHVYNLHNIRKILEEFDISDIMLSNIHIDVRVVYSENKIFIPKSHFDFNLTPDIYIILQVARDYSQMEFLGFFEPKMLNKNNTNGEYYFIEKEKLSSPIDLKSFVESFSGNTSRGVSEQDTENAEYLIVSMADNNVSEADKRQLLEYLKNSAELRNKFIEFENFEMLAYHAVSKMDIEQDAPAAGLAAAMDEINSDELDSDTVEDIELSNALNEDSTATEGIFDFGSEDAEDSNSEDGGISGGAIAGAAVVGAEIAGAAVASAALAGAAEGAEAVKDTVEAAEAATNAADTLAEAMGSVMNTFTSDTAAPAVTETVEDTVEAAEPVPNAADALAEAMGSVMDTYTEEAAEPDHSHTTDFADISAPGVSNVPEETNAEIPAEGIVGENTETETMYEESEIPFDENSDPLDTLFNEDAAETAPESVAEPVAETPSAPASQDEEMPEINPDELMQEPTYDDLFGDSNDIAAMEASDNVEDNSTNNVEDSGAVNAEESSSENIEFGSSESIAEDSSDQIEFTNGDDELIFENNDYDSYDNDNYGSEIQITSGGSSGDGGSKPAISPVMHTPISEATDLVSFEGIQLGKLPEMKEPEDMMETMEMDEFQNLVDSYVPETIPDMSETVEYDTIPEAAEKNVNAEPEVTSDAFVEEMPEEVESEAKQQDNVTSDDFVEEMPEEVESDVKPQDNVTSDDFVEEMPEAIRENNLEWSSSAKTPAVNELKLEIPQKPLKSDDLIQDIPDDIFDEKTEAKEAPASSGGLAFSDIEDIGDINDEDSALDGIEEIDSAGEAAPAIEDIPHLEEPEGIAEAPEETAEEALSSEDSIPDDFGEIDAIDEAIPEIEDIPQPEESDSIAEISEEAAEAPADTAEVDMFGDLDGIDAIDETVSSPMDIPQSEELNAVTEETAEIVEEAVPAEDDIFGESIPQTEGALPETPVAKGGAVEGETLAKSVVDAVETGAVAAESEFDVLSDIPEGGDIVESAEDFLQSEGEIQGDESDIGVLYTGAEATEINSSSIEGAVEDYDFRPKRKGLKLMPIFAILAAVVFVGSVVGFLVKSKNSIDSETLLQSSTEDAVAGPETDNTNILANENEIQPAIPTDMEDIVPAPTAEAAAPAKEVVTEANKQVTKEEKQVVVKNAKEAIKQQREQATAPAPKTPLNASKTVTLKQMSWEVPDYLSYSDNIRKYLQTAGKSIKLTLSSDLLLTNEYIYSNKVKVSIKLNKNGDIQDIKVASSSGSQQVDKIVLQTVKETLNVVKPPQGEVPTPDYSLGLIIYL